MHDVCSLLTGFFVLEAFKILRPKIFFSMTTLSALIFLFLRISNKFWVLYLKASHYIRLWCTECQILVPHYLAAKICNLTKLPGYNGNYKRESFSHFFIVAIIIIFINTRHNLDMKLPMLPWHQAFINIFISFFFRTKVSLLFVFNTYPKKQKLTTFGL